MSKQHRRQYHRESPDVRRQDLIGATLDIISESGFSGASVREISKRANVTQGLIRHYFSTKEELINAAYEHHMSNMTEQALIQHLNDDLSAVERLAATIHSNLTNPVLDERNVILWASFLGKLRIEPGIRQTHKATYLKFREGLEKLIHSAFVEVNRESDKQECRRLAIACNALIDGLWLEGGLMPSGFDPEEIVELGLESVGALVGLNLRDALPPAILNEAAS